MRRSLATLALVLALAATSACGSATPIAAPSNPSSNPSSKHSTTSASGTSAVPANSGTVDLPSGSGDIGSRLPGGQGTLDVPVTAPRRLDLPGFDAHIVLVTCTLVVNARNDAIGFAKDSAMIGPDGIAKLGAVSALLTGASDVDVTGHSSTEGAAGHNQVLSEQRARAVADVLAPKVAPVVPSVHGAGATQPVVFPDDTEAKRAENRRVVITAHIQAEECHG